MKKITDKMISLYYGSPPPMACFYQMGCIELLFGKYSEWTEEERDKEHKRRLELYKKDWKEYHIQRKKELDELVKLSKENGN